MVFFSWCALAATVWAATFHRLGNEWAALRPVLYIDDIALNLYESAKDVLQPGFRMFLGTAF